MTGESKLSAATLALLDRYLAGECSADEQREVAELLASSPEVEAGVGAVRRATVTFGAQRPATDDSWNVFRALWMYRPANAQSDSAKAAINSEVDRQYVRMGRSSSQWAVRGNRTLGSQPLRRYAVVGAILAALLVALGVRQTIRPKRESHRYATRSGECATVVLADGSRVVLAPQSTLVVDAGFGGESRRVTLTGEAYFDVAHHENTPFLVQSGAVTTSVMGTMFDVKHYPTDHDVQVVVMTGKVAVASSSLAFHPEKRSQMSSPLILTAGRRVLMSDSNAVILPVEDSAAYTSWTTGRLVFRGAPIPDVLAALGRWYGFEFRLADSTIATGRLSATFEHQSERGMFVVLTDVLDVTLTFHDRVVTLHPRGILSTPVPTRTDTKSHLHPRMEVGR